MKLAARLGLLTTLFVGACHCPKAHNGEETGRWQLQPAPNSFSWMLTDTATGRVWFGAVTPRAQPSDPFEFVWHDLASPAVTK